MNLHNAVEDLLLGKRDDLPEDIAHYTDFFQELKSLGAQPEVKWGVDENWNPCDFDSPDAMLRGIIDIRLPLKNGVAVYELKTGKYYQEHHNQMNLYATVELVKSETEKIDVIAIYLDQNKDNTITYPRMMLKEYKELWNRKIEQIEKDTRWMTSPGFHCRWCDFSKAAGGPCPF